MHACVHACTAELVTLPVWSVHHATGQTVHDTLGGDKRRRSSRFHYEAGEHYLACDMALPRANQQMEQLAQQLRQGTPPQRTASSGGSRSTSTVRIAPAPLLSAVLLGGAFAYVVDGNDDAEWELPHGVGDWTVSHHLWNQQSPSAHRTSARRSAAEGGCPFPIYFHCESHRAGAVNWRTKDAHLVIDPHTRAALLTAASAAAAAAAAAAVVPAYWLCVDGEAENLALFQHVMAVMAGDACYSVDHERLPAWRSLEPLLRAGVCMRLLRQYEHELVVLAPGVPHCVFTPPAATKISRNWMTPQSLLAAAVRALHNTTSERAQWVRCLHEQPLRCVLLALRRLHADQPEVFSSLVVHPQSSVHLRIVVGRAMANTDDVELQEVARHVSRWMQPHSRQAGTLQLHLAAPPAASPPSGVQQSLPTAAAMDRINLSAEDEAAAEEKESRTAASMTYRDGLVAQLRRECPLSSALHLLDGLLLASVPSATVQELCTELTLQQPATTVQEVRQAIDTAHKQGHARAAKRQCLDAAEQEVQAALQAKLQRAGVSPPDMWRKLAEFKARLETVVAPAQRECTRRPSGGLRVVCMWSCY